MLSRIRTALTLLTLACAFALPGAAQAVTPPPMNLEAPLVLAGHPGRLAGFIWKVGHEDLKVENAVADVVLWNGAPVGLYFEGQGQFRYTSAYALEFPLFRNNAERNASPILDKVATWESTPSTLGFSLAVQRGLLLGAPASAIQASEAPSLEASFAAFQQPFLRPNGLISDQVEDQPVVHDLAQQALGAAGGFALGWIEARKDLVTERLVFRYDPVVTRTESLTQYNPIFWQSSSYQDTVPLSCQPIGWTLKNPPPPHQVLTAVDLRLEDLGGGKATLAVDETVVPTASTRLLRFNLESLVERSNAMGNLLRGDLILTSVQDGSGHELPFSHQQERLLVDLGHQAAANTPLRLRFQIQGNFLLSPNGDSFWELGTEAWFPQPLAIQGQLYTVHATVLTPKPWVPVVPGTLVRRGEENGKNLQEIRMDHPADFFSVFGGAFKLHEETRDGQTIRLYTYAEQGGNVEKLMNMAFEIISYYEGFLGPFPAKEFTIVQKHTESHYGQAPPGLLIITDEAFNGQMDPYSQIFTRGVNQRFAHEIAHQYWGNQVKILSMEEDWISEAFAEYVSALAMRQFKARGISSYDAIHHTWKVDGKAATKVAPIPLANRIHFQKDSTAEFRQRIGLLYDKGPYLLDAWREKVGDKAFFAFLKLAQMEFKDHVICTDDLRQLMEAITKQDQSKFLDANYWGTDFPD
ncbi:MAG TPA: M1 family aminopeptidase [Holophagaceae bacterium]|nr:M1 family aminopeptidase [Holophagaceae bacterium]